jgi:hypothetical protein
MILHKNFLLSIVIFFTVVASLVGVVVSCYLFGLEIIIEPLLILFCPSILTKDMAMIFPLSLFFTYIINAVLLHIASGRRIVGNVNEFYPDFPKWFAKILYFLTKLFYILNWTQLSRFFSIPIVKMSYISILTIPILGFLFSINILKVQNYINEFPVGLKHVYFISYYLSISLVAYEIFCPPNIKKSVNRKYKSISQNEKLCIDKLEGKYSHFFCRSFCFFYLLLSFWHLLFIFVKNAFVVAQA